MDRNTAKPPAQIYCYGVIGGRRASGGYQDFGSAGWVTRAGSSVTG